MPDRPPFPIPENIHAPLQCFQMCIPNDPTWKQVIAGLLDELNQWYNWQRDEDRSGKECAQVWRNIYAEIDWSIMSCCCGDNPATLYQWTPDGHYQKSTDGGVTWEDAPESDPRNPQPRFPPYLPPDTVEPECTYADSIVQIIKNYLVDAFEEGATYQEIIGILISVFTTIMGALSPTVIGSIVVGIIGAVAVGIVTLSIPLFQAAMTTAVYDRLRCNLHDNMQTDGSFTQGNVDAIYARIGSEESGMAALFLQAVIAAAGVTGLTNMARSGNGSPTADCDCSDECVDNWADMEGAGHIIDITGATITVQSEFVSGVGYATNLITPDADTCCILTVFDSEVAINTFYWLECGEVFGVDPAHSSITAPIGHCVNFVSVIFAADTTAEFTFDGCD